MTALYGRSVASCAQPSEEAARNAHKVGDTVVCVVCHNVLRLTTWTLEHGEDGAPDGRWTHDGRLRFGLESTYDGGHTPRPLLVSDLPPGIVQVWDIPLTDNPALREILGADTDLVVRRRLRLRNLLRRRHR